MRITKSTSFSLCVLHFVWPCIRLIVPYMIRLCLLHFIFLSLYFLFVRRTTRNLDCKLLRSFPPLSGHPAVCHLHNTHCTRVTVCNVRESIPAKWMRQKFISRTLKANKQYRQQQNQLSRSLRPCSSFKTRRKTSKYLGNIFRYFYIMCVRAQSVEKCTYYVRTFCSLGSNLAFCFNVRWQKVQDTNKTTGPSERKRNHPTKSNNKSKYWTEQSKLK